MKPITRKEMLMAKAAGQSVPDIEPITREEYFLSQIANGGGGGGGGGGGSKVYELTQDTDTQTFTLHATYNEINADLSTGYPLVVRKTTREEDGILFLDLFAIIGIAGLPDEVYVCLVKGIVTNEQQTFTLEMTAASSDEYFVCTFD